MRAGPGSGIYRPGCSQDSPRIGWERVGAASIMSCKWCPHINGSVSHPLDNRPTALRVIGFRIKLMTFELFDRTLQPPTEFITAWFIVHATPLPASILIFYTSYY